MTKILVLEGDELWQTEYTHALRDLGAIIVSTLEEAEESWRDDGPFDCVVVCGQVDAPMDTVPFVKLVRQTFQGPIIAASNMPHNRRDLMAAGCSHQVPTSKHDTAETVREALNL